MAAILFSTFERKALALYRPPMRARSTFDAMKRLLKNLGRLKLKSSSSLTPAVVARFVAARSEAVCANSVIGELGYLKALCTWAVDERYLARSPFRGKRSGPGDWIRPTAPRRKPWQSIDEVARVMTHLQARATDWPGRRLHALASLVALTGVRRDEALHVQLGDLDLELRICRVMGHRRLKTLESAAPVPICDELAAVLAAWLPEAGPLWLFPGVTRVGPWTGGMPGSKPLDRLKAEARAAGVEGLTFQSLRHSWGAHADLANLAAAVRAIGYRPRG